MIRLAWRNLWRNRTRTAITGTAIALSLCLQLISYGTADSMYDKMFDAAVQTAGGAVLVHDKGYWLEQTPERVMTDYDGHIVAAGKVAGVETVIPRVIVSGLVASARGSAGVRIMGIIPEAEAKMDDKARFLGDGTFLTDLGTGRKARAPIVLGKKTVDDLKLELGDKVKVTASDPSGDPAHAAFWLVGVLDTGSDMLDAGAAYTTLEAAQLAFGMKDPKPDDDIVIPTAITQLGLLLESGADRHATKEALVAALGGKDAGLEALTWEEAMPEMLSFVELDKEMGDLTGFLIFLVVAFGIANTFLMAVLERVRELGLLSALGLTPARIGQLVVVESIILAVVFIGVGLALGYAGHAAIAANGIDIAAMQDVDFEMGGVVMQDMILYSKVNPERWATTSIVVLFLIVISAMYPAWRATRLEPAEAMRTYE